MWVIGMARGNQAEGGSTNPLADEQYPVNFCSTKILPILP
jgi:hypothetical protein